MSIRELARRFDAVADSFDSAAYVHEQTRDGLLARLEPMTIDARLIVDLGAATGASGPPLNKLFRRARVVSIDLSRRMLGKSLQRSSWFRRGNAVQADARQLPLAGQSVDVVFCNLLLPWLADRNPVFEEVSRVLRKDGLFVFSTLGPDSLAGFRHTTFADMHDVGDEMVRAGLRDPVLDVDRLAVKFRDRATLEREFGAVGAGDCVPATIDTLELQFELVYGHAWGAGQRPTPGEVRVDISRIEKRKI